MRKWQFESLQYFLLYCLSPALCSCEPWTLQAANLYCAPHWCPALPEVLQTSCISLLIPHTHTHTQLNLWARHLIQFVPLRDSSFSDLFHVVFLYSRQVGALPQVVQCMTKSMWTANITQSSRCKGVQPKSWYRYLCCELWLQSLQFFILYADTTSLTSSALITFSNNSSWRPACWGSFWAQEERWGSGVPWLVQN